jgi:RNA polymerase sigma-70 factor (ECF subfamily)
METLGRDQYVGKPIDAVLSSYKELGVVTAGLVDRIYNPFTIEESAISITDTEFNNRIRLQIIGLICSPALKQYNHAFLTDIFTTDELGIIDAQFTKAANERKAGSPVAELLSHIYSQTGEEHLIDFQELAGILGTNGESNEIVYYMDDFLRQISADEKNEEGIILLASLFARVVGAELADQIDQSVEIGKLVKALAKQGFLYNQSVLGQQSAELNVEPLKPVVEEVGETDAANNGYLSEDDESNLLPGVPIQIDDKTKELLERAAGNNPDAISELYQRYIDKIGTYVKRRVGDEEITADLTAEVFMKMLEAIRSGKGWKSSFSGWLYRIAHNRVIDYYRRRDKQNKVGLDLAENVGSEHIPYKEALRNAQAQMIRQHLDQLTTEQAQVIALRFLEGYSINEVVEILRANGKQATIGSVKLLQNRGLKKLRRLMPDEHSETNATDHELEPDDRSIQVEDPSAEALQALAEMGGVSAVRKLLGNLTQIEYQVLQLIFMEGRRIEEAASILAVDKQKVFNRISLGLKRWEELLKQKGKSYDRMVLRGILEHGLKLEKIDREPGSMRKPVLELAEDPNAVPDEFIEVGSEVITNLFGNLSELQRRIMIMKHAQGAESKKIMGNLNINSAKLYQNHRYAIGHLERGLKSLGFNYETEQIIRMVEYYLRQSEFLEA